MPAPFFKQANNKDIASMLRVNHAGEYAAKKIYEGQLKVNMKIVNAVELGHNERGASTTSAQRVMSEAGEAVRQFKSNDYSSYKKVLLGMLMNEEEHLAFFTQELINRDIRPTMFIGLWQYIAYYLGVISAMFGIKEAMLLTVGVEETIEQHYLLQLNELNKLGTESKLKDRIHQFMLEEVEHGHIAEQYLPEYSKTMQVKKQIISFGCKLAIFLSKKF